MPAGFFYMKIEIFISDSQVDFRLDQVVSQAIETCSRSQAVDLISKGEIQVFARKKRPGYRVKKGDKIVAYIPEPQVLEGPKPEAMDLPILFEDDHLLVVDKPAGLVVHPGPGNQSKTLVNGLLDHLPHILEMGLDPKRPGIVHRLDKDTSGLIVVAKTLQSLTFLQKEFKQRRVEKTYLALVEGNQIAEVGEIVLPIGRHPVKRTLMAVNQETGKYAKTSWQVRQRLAQGCLLEVHLFTGRTHQIRVHFRAMDMPLLGDRVYQYRRNRRSQSIAPRQMLHSWQLRFRHPYSGREMQFEAGMPQDFVQTMVSLGLSS